MSSSLDRSEPTSLEIADKKSTLTQEQRDFIVEKLGVKLEDLSSELDKPDFTSDLEKAISNPENQTEQLQFLGKYIYSKIIVEAKATGKDVIEIAQAKKQSGEWTIRNYINFSKYNRAAEQKIATAEGDKEDGIKEKFKELEGMEKRMGEFVKVARSSLSPEGQGAITSGVDTLKNDEVFVSSLEAKGYPKADILSGKYDETLAGYFLAQKGAELSKYIVPGKEKAFEKSIGNIQDALGIRPIAGVQKFLEDTMISGERKEATLQTTARLIGSGRYNLAETTYDAQTGYITLRGKSGKESTRIDTSKIPPLVEYTMNGLSLGYPIEKDLPSDGQKRRESGLRDISTSLDSSRKSRLSTILRGYSDLDEEGGNRKAIDNIENIQKTDLENIRDPEKRKSTIASIDEEIRRISSIDIQSENEDVKMRRKDGKESLLRSLEGWKSDLGSIAVRYDSLPDIPASRGDMREKEVRDTLSRLLELGYGELGQENLTKLMRSLQERDSGGGVWKSGKIDMEDPTIREAQIQELRGIATNISRISKKSYNEAFLEIQIGIKKNEVFRNIWNSPRGLNIWLNKQK